MYVIVKGDVKVIKNMELKRRMGDEVKNKPLEIQIS